VCSVLSEDSGRRFPVEQHLCNKCVGSLLQHRIGQILKELGFKNKIVKVEGNGVDLEVYDGRDHPILAGEILNWSPYSYMNDRRKNDIIGNLSKYSCRRVLIYAALKGEHQLDDLGIHGISKLRIGYQILPKYFYDHYAEQDNIESRRTDSRETRNEIKTILTNFLQSVGL
jgi:hypothetical protein